MRFIFDRRATGSLGQLLVLVWSLPFLAGCSERQVNPDDINYSGDSVADFVTALRMGDVITMDRLITADPELLGLQDEVGQTAMHYAALSNQPGVIKLLREKGLDPNVRDFEGRTALTVLEDSGFRYEEARKALLEIGGTG